MVSLQPPLCDFGWKARPFDLLGVDGRRYSLDEISGKNRLRRGLFREYETRRATIRLSFPLCVG